MKNFRDDDTTPSIDLQSMQSIPAVPWPEEPPVSLFMPDEERELLLAPYEEYCNWRDAPCPM